MSVIVSDETLTKEELSRTLPFFVCGSTSNFHEPSENMTILFAWLGACVLLNN